MSKINIFNKQYNKTASYIFSRDQNGVYYFALCRKVPYGARKRISGGRSPNTGAAGTDRKYCGKWGSFGGSVDRNSNHMLGAAISEIRDKANISLDSRQDVDIKWSVNNRQTNTILKLHKAVNLNGVAIFIFEMKYNIFRNIFPKFPASRGGAEIVTSSKGEIDLVSSFSTDQLKNLQNNEFRNNNNFMISYVARSFNDIVIPFLSEKSNTYERKHLQNRIGIISANFVNDRIVSPMPCYQEISGRRYI